VKPEPDFTCVEEREFDDASSPIDPMWDPVPWDAAF
jgi:hypothetical protein